MSAFQGSVRREQRLRDQSPVYRSSSSVGLPACLKGLVAVAIWSTTGNLDFGTPIPCPSHSSSVTYHSSAVDARFFSMSGETAMSGT